MAPIFCHEIFVCFVLCKLCSWTYRTFTTNYWRLFKCTGILSTTVNAFEVSTAVRAVKSSGKEPSVKGLEGAKQAAKLFHAKCNLYDETTIEIMSLEGDKRSENEVRIDASWHLIISIVPFCWYFSVAFHPFFCLLQGKKAGRWPRQCSRGCWPCSDGHSAWSVNCCESCQVLR